MAGTLEVATGKTQDRWSTVFNYLKEMEPSFGWIDELFRAMLKDKIELVKTNNRSDGWTLEQILNKHRQI